ncbi:hypothetical protein G6F57_019390 [Rhizopus arrhizus]|nr:hypothetical protein G6F57_019390 [Rhizopus arrhizus]
MALFNMNRLMLVDLGVPLARIGWVMGIAAPLANLAAAIATPWLLTRAAPRDVVLAALLIDELDENGYLGSPLEEILGWLPADTEPDIDELRAALSLLQSCATPT